jgi:hypothetical protein
MLQAVTQASKNKTVFLQSKRRHPRKDDGALAGCWFAGYASGLSCFLEKLQVQRVEVREDRRS